MIEETDELIEQHYGCLLAIALMVAAWVVVGWIGWKVWQWVL